MAIIRLRNSHVTEEPARRRPAAGAPAALQHSLRRNAYSRMRSSISQRMMKHLRRSMEFVFKTGRCLLKYRPTSIERGTPMISELLTVLETCAAFGFIGAIILGMV